MLILYYCFLRSPIVLLISYILQAASYYYLLKKIGIPEKWAFVPFIAEYKLTEKVYPKKITFFRPFILSTIIVLYAWYVSPYVGTGRLMLVAAFFCYGDFLLRLYYKVAKAFGKNKIYCAACGILPPVFLTLLGRGKNEYTQPEFPAEKVYSKPVRILRRVGSVINCVVGLLIVIAGCGFLAIRERFPSFLIHYTLNDAYAATDDVVPGDSIVTNADVLGDRLDEVLEENRTREFYFPDQSNNKDSIVYVYFCGADLENGRGLASANIHQMIESTKQGTGLKYVIQAGGSEHWYTSGIKNNSYGRYEIYDGKLTQVLELSSETNMSDSESLADFLTWGRENYSADRTMLILWDHGGGVTYGYGLDAIHSKDTMPVSDLVSAIEKADVKYDMIGFDACLMQDIEIANALEPYADYYIASEETEGGYGWFYTAAFSNLAKDPSITNEELGKQIIACYDPYNRALNDGEPDTGSTLSLIDLPAAAGAYKQLNAFFDSTVKAMADNPAAFANLSLAADNSYNFSDYQIDLIGFLEIADELDYNGVLYSNDKMDALIEGLQASVICRNADSAEGINGSSFTLNNEAIYSYDDTHAQLESLNNASEMKALDTYYSIIAAQKKETSDEKETDSDEFSLINIISSILGGRDLTQSDWYISGFENYDSTEVFVDIPLTQKENGYQVELPEKTWAIIADTQTMVYQLTDEVEGAYTRYLGNDYLGDLDENGHYMVSADENWVHINGRLVCYEADQVRITKNGEVYTGKVKARLNKTEDIYILIEWDAVEDGAPETAHVVGYVPATELNVLEEKGPQDLKAGDSIQFLFDYYDEEGKYVTTAPVGKKIRITKEARLKVTDQKMDPCTVQFGGVLKDVYQRHMTTEMIEYTID